MSNFFFSDDSHLTLPGYAVFLIVIAGLLIISAFIHKNKSSEKKTVLTTKQLVFSAAAMALATVCSLIKFTSLPMGGSVTLFSMLFVVLIGYWYGPSVGIMTAVAYGMLQLVIEPYFYTLPQVLLDYPLAFGALGLSGFFCHKKYGLQIGYIVGVLGRYIFSTISGVVFFGSYAPEGTPALLYSLSYQATYILPELIITLIVISIPAVSKALAYVKKNALSEN